VQALEEETGGESVGDERNKERRACACNLRLDASGRLT
jgi:hypothetical protein